MQCVLQDISSDHNQPAGPRFGIFNLSTIKCFVLGRLITDNVLVGFKCMHWLCNNKKIKDGYATLKLDMSKEHDRLEWAFLFAIMWKMGFPEGVIDLIGRCVTIVLFSVQVNDRIVGRIHLQLGIRQGDPLSPYLFVLCAQGLFAILKGYAKHQLFKGI